MKQLDPLVDLNLDKGPDETFIPGELPGCLASKQIKRDPEGEQAKDWESQGQESLKVRCLSLSHSIGRQRNSDPWDDAKIFLISFEQVAEACRWPKTEWMARLLPALTGPAREAFNGLETVDQEDYGKVKAAILRGAAFKMEAQRQHFRQFRYQEFEDPRRVYGDLRELCYQWLKPEKHTKEEILELLILEQFLAILPPEIQSWIRECDPENWVQTTDLMEDFLMSQQEAEMWKQQSSLKDDGEAERGHGRNVTKEQLLQVSVSSKDRVGDASNPAKELLFVENKEHILEDWRSAHPDDENSPCNHPVTFPPPEGQDFVETGPYEGSVDLKLAVHLAEGECSSLDPVPKAFYKEILQDDREKGTSLDHFTAAEIKKETLQLGGPELEGDHQTKSSCGEGFVKPFSHKEDTDLENTEGTTLHRRRLWEEGQTLNQHRTHISEQKQSSPECSEQFHSQPPMVKHRTIHIDVKPTERQDVPSCEKSFFAHRVIDLERERPGAAAMCGRRFGEWIQPSQCRVRQGGGDQVYQCSLCRKEFWRKRNLVAHQKIHTGERPYACSQCGKSFSEKAKLIRHERVHTGEKPYACPACPKSFSQRETLLKHRRLHAREKSYPGLIGWGRFWTTRDAVEGSLSSPREKLQ